MEVNGHSKEILVHKNGQHISEISPSHALSEDVHWQKERYSIVKKRIPPTQISIGRRKKEAGVPPDNDLCFVNTQKKNCSFFGEEKRIYKHSY